MIRLVFFSIAVLAASGHALAAPLSYTGRVERVLDGDTVSLRVADGRSIRVRMSEIDAPESGQPFGKASKRELARLVAGRNIVARVDDFDRYGRVVARVDRGGLDVNAQMVLRGAAWAYTRYQTDSRFPIWERQARKAKLGLWAQDANRPVPPWEWRAFKRGVSPKVSTTETLRFSRQATTAPASQFSCVKRYCKQMTSCSEAIFTLRQCSMRRLDGDGDGKPCESLCS